MAQHDYIIANQSGAAFRSDLNNGLAAIVSQNSGAAQPSTTYAYQWWADTTTGLLKIRNAANSAWITIGTLASANLGLLSLAGGTLTGAVLADDAGTAALPAIAFDGDPNTGIYRPGADQFAVATGGTGRVFVDSGGNVGIGAAASGSDKLYVQGGNVRVFAGSPGTSLEIGTGATGNQFAIIDLVGDTTYSDYALRIIRDNTGANTTASLRHRGTGTFSIVAEDAGKIALGTSNTNRLFVTDNGIGIGTSTPGYQLALATDSAGKPSTNTWTIASDERLKENIELANLDLCYLAVKTIPLKRYKWKDEVYSNTQVPDRHKLGWIAQDVQAVFPKAVTVHDFRYNQVFEDNQLISEDVIQDCLDLNADQLYAAMYGAMQKLIAKVETLETKLELLKV